MTISKIKYLLKSISKTRILILLILLTIGLILEMLSLGLLLPILSLLLDTTNVISKYPVLKKYLNFIGNTSQINIIYFGLALLISLYTIKALFLIYLNYFQGKFSSTLSSKITNDLFRGYLKQPYLFHLNRNSSLLFKIINQEIANFSGFIYNFITIVLELSAIIGIIFILIYREPRGAILVGLVLSFFSFLFHLSIKKKLHKWGIKKQFHSTEFYKNVLQGLSGVKEIKLLGRENYYINAVNSHNIPLNELNMKNALVSALPRLYFELLAVIGMSFVIIMMLIQNQPTEAIIPTIGLFVAAAFRILPSISRILNSFQQISLTKPSIELLYNEFVIINNNKKEKDITNHDLVLSNKIVLSNISFQYPNTSINTLTSICLEIKKGEFIGFIGKSGSGKSTLIDTILGLLEPQHGEVLIDGFNITKNLRGWQNQIGYVPQTIYLTDENLINNIAFGIEDKDIDLNAVKKAISLAQLDELVESLPNGLNTIVGERGIRLSGGQRQRIGIARALYYNPSILVLDEATSSLDLDTEMSVMKSVNSLHGQKTIIVVAHRMSTLSNCDKIYKLSNGEIISEGTPDKMII